MKTVKTVVVLSAIVVGAWYAEDYLDVSINLLSDAALWVSALVE